MKPDEVCGKCTYYNSRNSWCRRYPIKLSEAENEWFQAEEEWCGEFKSRLAEEVAAWHVVEKERI